MKFIFSVFLCVVLAVAPNLAFAAEIGDNSVTIGKKPAATGNKSIVFKRGAAGNPVIRWNESQSVLEYSNNGTDFASIGSGGGGGTGVNMLQEQNLNPDFESGGSSNWTASGTAVATATSGANLLFGKTSATWTPTTSGHYLRSALVTTTYGLANQSCIGSVWYKGGSTNLTLRVLDNSANVIATRTFESASTDARPFGVPFKCGAQGSQYRLELYATGSSAIVAIDRAHLGEVGLINLSQASVIGSAFIPVTASCDWARTSATMGAYAAVTACPGPTIESNNGPGTIQTTDTDLPQFTVNNLPPGTYHVFVSGALGVVTTGTGVDVAITDGTTTTAYTAGLSTPNASGGFLAQGLFTYTTTGNRTFQLFGATQGGAVQHTIFNSHANHRLEFKLVRYPTGSDSAISAQTAAWRVDANISGGNLDLGTANVATYSETGNSALTLTTNPGSLAVGIPCVNGTTNTVGASTCLVGGPASESNGISFEVPQAGTVRACASFTWALGVTSSSGHGAIGTFQVVETTAGSSTPIAEGKQRTSAYAQSTGVATNFYYPFRTCGEFTLATAGLKTFRLAYEQLQVNGAPSSSTIRADANASAGQPDIHWTVEPVTQNVPMPVFVGPNEQFRTLSSATTLIPSDAIVACDVSGGSFNLTLPLAATAGPGKVISIYRSSATSSNQCGIVRQSPDTISAFTSTVLLGIHESVRLVSDGASKWTYLNERDRHEWVRTATTSGTPSTTDASSSWVGSYSDLAVGHWRVNFASNTWNATPSCVCSPTDAAANRNTCQIQQQNSAQVEVKVINEVTGNAIDESFNLNCTGRR